MTFEGWILDARPAKGGLVLLLSDGRKRVRVCLRATFDLYLVPRDPTLVDRLMDHPAAVSSREEEWFAPPWYTARIPVQRVSFSRLSAVEEVRARMREEELAEVLNPFPDPITQTFYHLGYPATARVRVQGAVTSGSGEVPCVDPSRVRAVGDPLEVGYEVPGYSWAEVRFFDWFGETTASEAGRAPERFTLTVSYAGHPPRTEEGKLRELEGHAPLLASVDIAMFPRAFRGLLSGAGLRTSAIPIVLHRHSPRSPPLPDELVKFVEWSRVSFMPLREVAQASIGKALTANETHVAFRRHYLVPDRQARVERRKTLADLVAHDRGGILFRPRPGIYWNVAQLDFASMYPTLIATWNISPETVNAPSGPSVEVPGTGHRVEPASARRGIVPESLEWLIARREATRALARDDPVQDLRQAAIKWLLVASFGYLGFRNARFGKIEAHECVTALSRHYMGRSIQLATSRGYEVLHVMVDSLFVRRDGATPADYQALLAALREETGLGIKLEAHYDWVVLCNNKGTALGSPARYFGRLRDGHLKVKGLDIVRRDTPGVVKKAQAEALATLREVRTEAELPEALRHVEGLFERAASRVRRGDVPPEEFVFTVAEGRRAGGGRHDYRSETPFVSLVQGHGTPYFAELGFSGADTEHYARLLERAREQVTPASGGVREEPRSSYWDVHGDDG